MQVLNFDVLDQSEHILLIKYWVQSAHKIIGTHLAGKKPRFRRDCTVSPEPLLLAFKEYGIEEDANPKKGLQPY